MHSIGRLLELSVLVIALFCAAGAAAQEEEDERSRFVRFVERQISTPDRQIRLGPIEGALSSDVQIESITVADREGVWLRLDDVRLIWSRRALLSRRLEIELLEADEIVVIRGPLPAEGPSEPFDERDFELPELPVVLDVDAVRVPRVQIASGVVSERAYALSLAGSVTLDDGVLDAALDVERLDGSGTLTLEAGFSNETRVLDLEFLLSEPENGIVANLLKLEGRPAVTFAIEGSAPLAEFVADIVLTADGEQLLAGEAAISRTAEDGFRFVADVGGELEPLVPPLYRELVEAGSRLTIDATRHADGAVRIAEAELHSGVAVLEFSGSLAADGTPTELELQATLGAPDDAPIDLPGGGGRATVQSGRITARLGGEMGEDWTARFELRGLATPTISANEAIFFAEGTASDLANAAARRATFQVEGSITGLGSEAGIAEALGDALRLEASGAWAGGSPVRVAGAQMESKNVSLGFEGTVDTEGAEGDYAIEVLELARFSELAGRQLAGAVALSATGSAAFSGESFALAVDGDVQDLELGVAALYGLIRGASTLSGTVARSGPELRFEAFQFDNPQMALRMDGGLTGGDSQIVAALDVADVAALTEVASGGVAVEATVAGTLEAADIEAQVQGEDLVLSGRRFTDASGSFKGTTAGADADGRLALAGTLDGVPIEASMQFETLPDGRRVLQDLQAVAGESRLDGELTLLPGGLYSGALALESDDLSIPAPLLLMPMSGSVSAEIALSVADGAQSAEIAATAEGLAMPDLAGGVALGSANVELAVEDVFGAPLLSGTVTTADLTMGGFDLPALDFEAAQSDDATAWTLSATLDGGSLAARGSVARAESAYVVAVEALQVSQAAAEAQLARPFDVTVSGGQVKTSDVVLEAGDGGIVLSGELGDTLAMMARMEALPLSLLNAFQQDLDASGTLSGTAAVSGTRAAPETTFDLEAREVSFALLQLLEIDPLAAEAEGRFAGGMLTVDAQAEVSGRTVSLRGDIGEELDATLGIEELPLSLLDGVAPQLEPGGTVSAELHATGSLAVPEVSFELSGTGLSVAQLRAADVPGFDLFASGRFQGTTAMLSEAVVSLGGGRLTLHGTVGTGLDLAFDGTDLPLSPANALLPGIGLEGRISGSGTVTGQALDPQVTFDILGEDISIARLADGLPGLDLTAQGAYSGGAVRLDRGAATIGDGRVEVTGTVGTELDVSATATEVPLAVVGALLPVELEGDLSGSAQASGSPFDPQVTFDLRGEGITTPELRADGLPAVELGVQGSYSAGGATLTEAVVTAGNGRISASGTVGSEIDLSATANFFPLWISRAVRPDLSLDGTVTGSATLQGSLSAPQAAFDLQASDVTAAPLRVAELGSANAALLGSYEGGAVVLERALIDLGQGQVRLEGRAGEELDLILTFADFPAAAANAVQPGLGLTGMLSGTVSATGPSADPTLSFDLSGTGIRGGPLRRRPGAPD